MKYVVVHIPTGKLLSYKGTKKNGDLFCVFDSEPTKELSLETIEAFRKKCLSYTGKPDPRHKKFLLKSNAELQLSFIKTPLKFKSVAEAEGALLSASFIPTLSKFKITEEELVLFDIMEVEDD